jgi:hypothetical protein
LEMPFAETPFLARAPSALAATSLILLVLAACSAGRIGGTYVSHGPNSAEMLQLTETGNGQISGVFDLVELQPEGNITSRKASVSGVSDGEELTLNTRSGLLSLLDGTNVAGTIKGGTIRLQIVDSKGNVTSDLFDRGAPDDFRSYVDQLRSKGEGIVLSGKLTDGAQRFRQTVRSAEEWIVNAQLHTQRIPTAESRYQEIEGRMQSLVAREQSISQIFPRVQIANIVGQGELAGGQLDNELDQVWDIGIGKPGTNIEHEFASWGGDCGSSDELRKRGAASQAVDDWKTACVQALAERTKFRPIYQRVMEQRSQLKTFQSAAQARRKALVEKANRMNFAQ